MDLERQAFSADTRVLVAEEGQRSEFQQGWCQKPLAKSLSKGGLGWRVSGPKRRQYLARGLISVLISEPNYSYVDMCLLLLERETDERINSESDRDRTAGEKV